MRIKLWHFDNIFRKDVNACPFTVDILLFTWSTQSVSVSDEPNLVWTFIFHPLQIIYHWHCFLCARKTMWWVLQIHFSCSSVFCLTERIGVIVLWATVDVVVDWTLPFAEGEKMKDLVNDWELNPFMFSSQILLFLFFLFLGKWLFQASLVAQR